MRDNNTDIPLIYKRFDENFQKLTETRKAFIDTFIDKYGAGKVSEALNIAIKYNKRNLAYVEGILSGDDCPYQPGDTVCWIGDEDAPFQPGDTICWIGGM